MFFILFIELIVALPYSFLIIIELEKIGFTRETASHIKANKDKLLIMGEGNSLIDNFSLNLAEFDTSKNDDLKRETKKIRTNLPELFK